MLNSNTQDFIRLTAVLSFKTWRTLGGAHSQLYRIQLQYHQTSHPSPWTAPLHPQPHRSLPATHQEAPLPM